MTSARLNPGGVVMRSRTTAKIVVTLAIACLVGVLAWWAADAFWVYQATRGARSVLLTHRAMQFYAMRPTLYAGNAKGATAEELNTPESFSSSDIVGEQRRVYDETRRQMGFAPLYYRIASNNPLNPANRADEREEKLISLFDTHREVNHYQGIVERNGKSYLYYVLPFQENTQACLHCHGHRADAPVRLQARYPGPGGFGEQTGHIRALESVAFPIDIEKRGTVAVAAMLLALSSLFSGLVLTNRWLSRRVRERTSHLERESAERRKAEEALRMTQFAVDVMLDSAYRCAKDGTVVYANQAGVRELGYTQEELVGKLNAGNLNEEVTPARWEEIWRVLSTKGSYRTEGQHRRKDGTLFPVDVCVSYMHFDHSEYAWVVVRDLTWRKQLEEQVIEAQKMEAIGTLASGIAHDFNNILAALHGFAELAHESIPADCTGRDDIEQIMKASARARDLVRQILDFSRKSRRDKMPIRVGVIASEALRLLGATLPATIAIRERIDLELWAVVDATGFHQIVMNLCTNAFQAMSSTGGVLVVELSRVDAGTSDIPPSLLPGPCAHLRVGDSGSGMPPEALSRIFEPYFTTRGSAGGTGLGLAVVHGIVTSYGGAVTVHSELGRGTTFDVWLPVAQAPDPARRTHNHSTGAGDERILVVDDEEGVRTIACRILTGLGYSVRAAPSPEEALDLFLTDPSAFDLVVTDQTMPKMTGLALIERLRETSPSVKVVLMSGVSPILQGRSASEMGIDAFVAKPFTRRELAAAVRAALGRQSGSPSPNS
jgi:PAS domain S-box-containing protein